MSIRRRNDSVKSGHGIDGAKGENFTRQYNQNSWNVTPSGGNERSYSRNAKKAPGDRWAQVGATTQPLREVEDFGYRASKRDIFDDVLENDGPRGGASAAIRAGVNRSQED
jgi:hypothetical protein